MSHHAPCMHTTRCSLSVHPNGHCWLHPPQCAPQLWVQARALAGLPYHAGQSRETGFAVSDMLVQGPTAHQLAASRAGCYSWHVWVHLGQGSHPQTDKPCMSPTSLHPQPLPPHTPPIKVMHFSPHLTPPTRTPPLPTLRLHHPPRYPPPRP